MRAELKRIQHELGQTMVYVTHDQVEAMGMADRIAVMSQGVLQQYGSPDDLYNRPANLFVARFVGSVLINILPARYERANGAATVTPPGEGARAGDPAGRRGRGPPAARVRADALDGLPPRDAAARRARLARRDAARAGRARRAARRPRRRAPARRRRTDVRAALRARPAPARSATTSASRVDPDRVHVFDDATGLAVR